MARAIYIALAVMGLVCAPVYVCNEMNSKCWEADFWCCGGSSRCDKYKNVKKLSLTLT